MWDRTSEGLFPAASVERLKEIGDWIKVNGDAIYAVRQLRNFKEGNDIRYTLSPDGKYINAFVFNLPAGQLNIKQIKPVEGSVIRMYGLDTDLKWTYDDTSGLTIEMPEELTDPSRLPCKYVWVLKIEGVEI